MKNNEEKTSMKSRINIANLPNAHLRKQSKTHDCLNSSIIIEFIIFFFNSFNSSSVALSSYSIK